MRRIGAVIGILIVGAVLGMSIPRVGAQPQNAQQVQVENVYLKATIHDYLLEITGGVDPVQALKRQAQMIGAASRLVAAHGDTVLVQKFREVGFQIEGY